MYVCVCVVWEREGERERERREIKRNKTWEPIWWCAYDMILEKILILEEILGRITTAYKVVTATYLGMPIMIKL